MARNYGDYFNIAHIEPESHIYGPGKRFVVWLQGCSLACDGCWNQQMWSTAERQLVHRKTLLESVLATQGIAGLTLLGGEPLQQQDNAIWLMQQLATESALDVMLYTGYEQDELESRGVWNQLLDMCDWLVLGRYQHALRDTTLRWRGSANQRLLTRQNGLWADASIEDVNEVELIISADGSVNILGYPDDQLIDGLSSPSSL